MLPTRRHILAGLSGTAAAGLFCGAPAFADEAPPETRSIRLSRTQALCNGAPKHAAEELLRAEGFTEVRYLDVGQNNAEALASGKLDFDVNYTSNFIGQIDGGGPVTLLAGIHIGCFELFARDDIRGIGDLKGRSIGVQALESTPHQLLSIMLMAAQVGVDPVKDIHWVTEKKIKPRELFVAGKIDAFLGFPPEPQELRARKIGHVLLNTATDRPWSQYFCCMLGGNPEFVRRHPVATKRVVRAVVKAVELCASNPTVVARQLVDGRFLDNYDYALQMLQELPYSWRDYSAEDAVRFYALRLREAGFIKSTPQKIITENTDWRFLDELKRELKG